MPAPIFIGDEVTAAGYRLAGAHTIVPETGGVAASFGDALRNAEFVIITAECAAELPAATLDEAVRTADPLVAIVSDVAGRVMPIDVAIDVDRVLGIEK